MATYDAGVVTAYGAAVRGGYTGTYEQFCAQQANYAASAAAVEQAKDDAEAAAQAAEEAAATLVIDDTLTQEGQAADAKKVGDELSSVGGVPAAVKTAIYTLLNAAAYTETGLAEEIAVVEDWAANHASKVTLDKSTLSIMGADSVTLVATVFPSDTSDTVVWASSDTSIATVNDGVVTSVGNGSCTITATAGAVSATCAVTVSGIVGSHTVTNNLTNCSNSNDVTTVADGSSYNAVITANSGYSLGTVTCTMDGVEQIVTNGTINIASVTGNIVITATAIAVVSFMTPVTGWGHTSAGIFSNITEDGFTMESNGYNWSTSMVQRPLSSKTAVLSGKRIRVTFDATITGRTSTSEKDGVVLSISGFTTTSPVGGSSRAGGTYDLTVVESGAYVVDVAVSETNITPSESNYLGFMFFMHCNSGTVAVISNITAVYY